MVRRLILIGDSIRIGYEPFVREALAGVAEVQGPAENGGTSAKVRANLAPWALEHRPDVVHINAGLHDLARLGEVESDGVKARQVSLEDYRENVRAILEDLRATGAKVVWALTTPVVDPWHRARKPFIRLNADVDAYNAAATEIARAADVVIHDLNAVAKGGTWPEPSGMTPDGVHYTPEGYQNLAAAVVATVRPLL